MYLVDAFLRKTRSLRKSVVVLLYPGVNISCSPESGKGIVCVLQNDDHSSNLLCFDLIAPLGQQQKLKSLPRYIGLSFEMRARVPRVA